MKSILLSAAMERISNQAIKMKHLGFLPEKAGSSEKGDRNIQNYINKNKHI